MRAATTSAAIASALPQPVSQMTAPAIAVATKAYMSLRMCWNAPSTLRLLRSALAMSHAAAALTAIPARAVPKTRSPLDLRWLDEPPDALVDEVGDEHHEGQPVDRRGQDLGALPADVWPRARGGRPC